MLDVMRSNARSSLITLIFAAIIVTFIFSFGRGSSGFKGGAPETWAAKVNGELVTATDFSQAYTNRFRQQSSARNGQYTTDQAKADNLKKLVLDSMVDQELISQEAPRLGLAVSDKEVADAIEKNPQFQQSGRFDFEYYKRLVENGYGMSVNRFEDAWRRDMLRGKVVQAAIAGAQTSDDEIKAQYIAEHESASIYYVRFTPFMFRDKADATDAEAEAYLKAHGDELQKRYDEEKQARFSQPQAAKVRIISVNLKPGASADDEKAARAKIDLLYAEVKGGKDFAQVARTSSEDTVTNAAGGDLGYIGKGQSAYGKTIEEEASKLKKGDVSEVFKDRTGFHILKAEEVREAHVQPFDEVKKQMAMDAVKADKSKELAKKKGEETLAQLRAGKNLSDLFPPKKTPPGQFDFASFTSPQSAESDSFHPTGGFIPGIGVAPHLSAAVFALTTPGALPAAPIEEPESIYVFKLKSRERADPSKLDDAERSQIRERLVAQKQSELYMSWIDDLRKKAKIVENNAVLSYDAQAQQSFNPDD